MRTAEDFASPFTRRGPMASPKTWTTTQKVKSIWLWGANTEQIAPVSHDGGSASDEKPWRLSLWVSAIAHRARRPSRRDSRVYQQHGIADQKSSRIALRTLTAASFSDDLCVANSDVP